MSVKRASNVESMGFYRRSMRTLQVTHAHEWQATLPGLPFMRLRRRFKSVRTRHLGTSSVKMDEMWGKSRRDKQVVKTVVCKVRNVS